jgi:pyruvate ferredoxin oxidoreductase delta subunit
MAQLKGYKELSPGARVEGGSSVNFNTGSWRAMRPSIQLDKCINCMLCFLYCPDNSIKIIQVSDKQKGNPEVTGIDLDHCKGCGLCANVCPVKCIIMESETESVKKDKEKKNLITKGI